MTKSETYKVILHMIQYQMYMAAEFSIKKTYDVKCLVLLLKVSK